MSLSLFRLRHTLLLGLVAATLAALLAPRPVAAETGERCFVETGFCIAGPIRAYWERNGGLAVFGYPIGPERREVVEGSWTGPVQWFERDRLEDHSNEGLGVLAGRLGARALELQGINWQALPGDDATQPGCRFFRETQFNLCGPFLRYWERNGGLAVFGYPLTREREETIAGRTYTVQYFERRRMELHPENAGTPYEVLLGLLGRDVLAAEGDRNVVAIAPGDLSADGQQPILDAAYSRLRQEYPDSKLALGLADVIEGRALVIARPYGPAPLYVYLTRQEAGWRVLAFAQQPGAERARRAGFPEQLLGGGDRAALVLAQLSVLQSPRGAGLNAFITRPRIAGDHARFYVVPAASENLDPASTFYRRVNGVWVFSTAGTAFPEEQLQQEGVPEELWPNGEIVRGPQ